MTTPIDWTQLRPALDVLATRPLTRQQVATRLGVSRSELMRYCAANGVRLTAKSAAVDRMADSARGQTRPDWVRALISQGMRARQCGVEAGA